jgi:predicted DNA-binding protein
MREQHYKKYSYRLNDETAELFKSISRESGKSYNLILFQLLKQYEEFTKQPEGDSGDLDGRSD